VRSLLEPAIMPRPETLPLIDALGRVTASAVLSPVDLPLFRNSQMDGFAVAAADLGTIPAILPIVGEIAARPGTPAPLVLGTTVRIMTGAVVPEGADTIVPVEDTTVDGDLVTISHPRWAGEFVRERGSDVQAGAILLAAGLRLGSRHLAGLAAAGLEAVQVRARVRVAVITTGAELIAPGEPASMGQVYDANAVALVAAVAACGADVAFTARVVDDPGLFLAALRSAAAVSDVILTSGGISQGEYEVVREVLEPLGATVTAIAMQPGGPQATAVVDGVPVISFPGNPVSTQISFEVFVAPILREAAALPPAVRRRLVLATDVRSVRGKRQFLRGRLIRGRGGEAGAEREPGNADRVELVAGPGSHLVAGLAASDVLIDIPAEITEIAAGDPAETWQL
jgi:molybdopterin molybdotransferase